MNALFGLGVKETDRTDIVQALLQGMPGLNQQTGKPVDTIKLNLGTPPVAEPEPPRRARRATTRASRTAAVSPTT